MLSSCGTRNLLFWRWGNDNSWSKRSTITCKYLIDKSYFCLVIKWKIEGQWIHQRSQLGLRWQPKTETKNKPRSITDDIPYSWMDRIFRETTKLHPLFRGTDEAYIIPPHTKQQSVCHELGQQKKSGNGPDAQYDRSIFKSRSIIDHFPEAFSVFHINETKEYKLSLTGIFDGYLVRIACTSPCRVPELNRKKRRLKLKIITLISHQVSQ